MSKKFVTRITSLILAWACVMALCAMPVSAADTTTEDVMETYLTSGTLLDHEQDLPSAPLTEEAFKSVMDYIAVNNLTTVTLRYDMAYSAQLKQQIISLIKATQEKYQYEHPEYFNYTRITNITFSIKSKGFKVKLIIHTIDDTVNLEQRVSALKKAYEVHQALYDEGVLDPSMTEADRAMTILQWLSQNTTYQNDDTALCHTAYCVFENGYGVCDAYSSAFQLLLALDGIESKGQTGYSATNGEYHHWSKVCLDTQWLNVDACWSDDGECANTKYFAKTDEEFAQTHIVK